MSGPGIIEYLKYNLPICLTDIELMRYVDILKEVDFEDAHEINIALRQLNWREIIKNAILSIIEQQTVKK